MKDCSPFQKKKPGESTKSRPSLCNGCAVHYCLHLNMFRYLITLAYIFPVKELHVNFSVWLIMWQLFSLFMYELKSFLCQKIWLLFPKIVLYKYYSWGCILQRVWEKEILLQTKFLQLFILFITLGIFSQLEIYDGIFSVFTAMSSKIKIKNHSIQKAQNLGNEGKWLYKKPQQESGVQNISYAKQSKKCFPRFRNLCQRRPHNSVPLSGFSLRILVAGKRCNVKGEYCEWGSMSE